MANHSHPDSSLRAAREDTWFFGHPRGLAVLFFTEMWERFAYYGMRALLILFMTAPAAHGGLGFSIAKAGSLYGLYTGAVYMVSLPGGWVADRILGQRRAVLIGGAIIAAGQFCLAAPSLAAFYTGLLLMVLGTGLLKPNVSTIVGQLYAPGDARRDAGFSIFYMGINLGAFLSPVVCGWTAQRLGWRVGLGLAGVGMVLGLCIYTLAGRYLGSAGLHPAGAPDAAGQARMKAHLMRALLGVLAAAAIAALLTTSGMVVFTAELISDMTGVGAVVVSVALFAWLLLGRGWTPEERKRLAAILVLFLASMVFWFGFEQAGSSLNLFADRNVDNHVFGFAYPASWFQSVQPAFIILLAPVFAWFWLKLGRREPSSPAKFVLGLFFVAAGFAVLIPVAGGTGVSPWWLVLTYFLHTLGELSLSPVGLSAMTKLAPQRVAGMIMGLWFLSLGAGNYLGGRMAALYGSLTVPTIFMIVAATGAAAGLVMMLLLQPTKRMMSGVK
jgi:proton-dependent oligopeptide transporter, POT family